jgi:hypothetical protein
MERWGISPDRTGNRPRTSNPGLAAIFGASGYTIARVRDEESRRAGITAHTGVVHPDEFVDEALLTWMAEEELGFTADEVHGVYRQGRKSEAQVRLRDRIDARLLEVEESGGCMTELARVFGLRVTADGCFILKSAIRRARAARGAVAA